jgi:hypothetical protein
MSKLAVLLFVCVARGTMATIIANPPSVVVQANIDELLCPAHFVPEHSAE